MLRAVEAFVFWLALAIVILAYMTMWYAAALWTKRYDAVDSAWGLGFVLVAWLSLGLRAHFGFVQVVSAALVSVWGLRLFGHIANRNWRKSEDDQRYLTLRSRWGSAAKLRAYTNIFLLQGVLILAVSLPIIGVAFADRTLPHTGTYVGWFVWLLGITLEATADYQLAHFLKRRPAGSREVMTVGLWRYSRHPNYFGELMAWWGAAFVSLSLGEWWGVAGAVVITLLITKISGIPPLEKRYRGDENYAAYRARTSILIPLPPKKS